MDLLPWNKINKFVDILPTKRKFYDKYLYKLVYDLRGAHIFSLYSKNFFSNNFHTNRLSESEREKIDVFVTVFRNKDLDLRWRSEGNSLSIFGQSEHELYELASNKLLAYKSSLRSVTRVMNEQDLADLEAGHVIMSEKTAFPYKVTIRQGLRNTHDRHILGNYLKSIRSEVKISDFLLQGMIHQNKYLHSCYFYVNDPKIVSMIALVAPNIIKRVQTVVVRKSKSE